MSDARLAGSEEVEHEGKSWELKTAGWWSRNAEQLRMRIDKPAARKWAFDLSRREVRKSDAV